MNIHDAFIYGIPAVMSKNEEFITVGQIRPKVGVCINDLVKHAMVAEYVGHQLNVMLCDDRARQQVDFLNYTLNLTALIDGRVSLVWNDPMLVLAKHGEPAIIVELGSRPHAVHVQQFSLPLKRMLPLPYHEPTRVSTMTARQMMGLAYATM